MTELYSFDVFDTVLTRAVGSPESLFLLLGRKLLREALIPCSAESFARARIQAEERAHRSFGANCTLEDIYAELANGLGLDPDQAAALADQECAAEEALVRLVPGAPERIQEARRGSGRVVFVSDMYLPSSFLIQLLSRYGIWQEGDKCYVSCEHGKLKQSGKLFEEILFQERVAARYVTHQGNSLEGDIRPARALGMGVSQVEEANANRYERLLERHTWETEGFSSVLAGASREARLEIRASNDKEAMIRDVTAGVASPALLGFTLWVLHRAQQLGLDRLYFLSRDGQVLADMARHLVRRLELSCEIRYLYGSRQSWNLPAVRNASPDELTWIWDTTDFLSVETLLARVGLYPESLKEDLISAGFGPADWRRTLRATERDRLGQVLQSETARQLIVEQATQKRQVLLNYLEQEGLFESKAWGFVDLGWYGSMQNALAAIVSERGFSVPVGFYFGLFKGSIADKCSMHREAYYFDERLSRGFIDRVKYPIALMEMFCAGDHGTVVDFHEEEGQVKPILSEPVNAKVIQWGLALVRRTLDSFVDSLLFDPELVNTHIDLREAISDVLAAFWLHPLEIEARAWAEFPWEDGLGKETRWNPLAQPYGWNDVIKAASLARIPFHHRSAWYEGSLTLSSLGVRLSLASIALALGTFRSWRYRLYRRIGVRTS